MPSFDERPNDLGHVRARRGVYRDFRRGAYPITSATPSLAALARRTVDDATRELATRATALGIEKGTSVQGTKTLIFIESALADQGQPPFRLASRHDDELRSSTLADSESNSLDRCPITESATRAMIGANFKHARCTLESLCPELERVAYQPAADVDDSDTRPRERRRPLPPAIQANSVGEHPYELRLCPKDVRSLSNTCVPAAECIVISSRAYISTSATVPPPLLSPPSCRARARQ